MWRSARSKVFVAVRWPCFMWALSTASVALFFAVRVKCSLLLYDNQLRESLVYSKCSVPCCYMTISFVRVLSTESVELLVAV